MKKWLTVSLALNIFFLGAVFYRRLVSLGMPKTAPVVAAPYTESLFYKGRVDSLNALFIPASAVVFVGDSLTECGDWAETFGPRFINRGVRGDTVGGVKDRIQQVLAARPRRIYLMIGVNDLLNGRRASAIVADYRELVAMIHQHLPANSMLILQSVLPVCSTRWPVASTFFSDLDSLNTGIAGLADGSQVLFLDLRPVFSGADGQLLPALTSDGLHLNAAGYAIWNSAIKGK